mmetsp:Transcript_10334/g.32769  ORF Transcript_10334/g.32769 Transcript_10334/m.32769 type:complete len:247 (-) Transcript_10334:24-764(-)
MIPPSDGDANVLETRGREAVDVGLVVVRPVAVGLVIEPLPKVDAHPHGFDDLHGRGPVPHHRSLAARGGFAARGGRGAGSAAAPDPLAALAFLALIMLRIAPLVATAGAAIPGAASGHPPASALLALRLLPIAKRVRAAGAGSPGATAAPDRRRPLGKHLGHLLLVALHGGRALSEGGDGMPGPLYHGLARLLELLQLGDGLLADRQRESRQRRQDRSGEGAVTHHGNRGQWGGRCRRAVYGNEKC